MKILHIDQSKVTPEVAQQLMDICPFSAFSYEDGQLNVEASCKMCGLCVKDGPEGVATHVEVADEAIDKDAWKGIAVYVEHAHGEVHNVTKELIGKARELAAVTGHPVYALFIGSGIAGAANSLLRYGVDAVYTYDYPELLDFRLDPYANAFADFIEKVHPSSIMVGATNVGRSLAPKVAARFRTGLTADCTKLEMKENTDLVQIRPAFGGNIMAQIVTPNHRPQFCTVRYKIFSAPAETVMPSGEIRTMELMPEQLISRTEILATEDKPKDIDISEADVIVAVGRGFKSEADLGMARELADLLGAQMACTRSLIEDGWFGPKRQIGLSGRTVNASLIITLGISGAVQFTAGMRGSECIVAVNTDPAAPIFDVAHHGIVGDLYQVVPMLIERCKEAVKHAV